MPKTLSETDRRALMMGVSQGLGRSSQVPLQTPREAQCFVAGLELAQAFQADGEELGLSLVDYVDVAVDELLGT